MTPRTAGTVFGGPYGIKSSLDDIGLDYGLVKSSATALEPADGRPFVAVWPGETGGPNA